VNSIVWHEGAAERREEEISTAVIADRAYRAPSASSTTPTRSMFSTRTAPSND